jgi:Cobalamin synthesis protein cobW C-terminal domain
VNAEVPVDVVLGLGAFDLDRALAVDGSFLEPQYPFEWAGAWQLAAGKHVLKAAGEHGHDHDHGAHGHDAHAHHHDHEHAALKLALLPLPAATEAELAKHIETAVRVFAEKSQAVDSGDHFGPGKAPVALAMSCMGGQYCIDIDKPGAYALFTEHHPDEFGLALGQPPQAERRFASHHHDAEIRSIGIEDARGLDARKVNDWLSYLLQNKGADILRMKGVLNIKGDERRYVFHGVHMMFDGRPERIWGSTPRNNQLVFIGRNLDRGELLAGFAGCIAASA